MRWPLKHQFMLPMACVMLATLLAVSTVDAWLAGRRTHRQIEKQLQDIGETLRRTTFPLTDTVLQHMRGLSGAEYVVANQAGIMVASSRGGGFAASLPAPSRAEAQETLALERRVIVDGQSYFHAPLDLRRPIAGSEAAFLHVFYPEVSYQRAWREAVLPPITAGVTGLVVGLLVSRAIAFQVARPIDRLRGQVERIACGQFVPLAVPSRNDELRDLTVAINTMAEMLADYESEVRRNEQLRTLGRLGGGIAHQLRNSATGCRMALDVHQRECPVRDDESLDVARRQIELMEEYLQRFLTLGKCSSLPLVPRNLAEIVDGALGLIRPKAEHLGVELHWSAPVDPPLVAVNAEAFAQVIVNLVLNAIEAVAQSRHALAPSEAPPRVIVRLVCDAEAGLVCLDVMDTGAGPAEHVRDKIFEPLVSEKADGAGLGLSVAREVIAQHGGTIAWHRSDHLTCFTVELPISITEAPYAKRACC